jgi:CRISPR-associated protein Csb2
MGRYHSTQWGRSVNEAALDWPPSPWRLLRALYATWRCRAPDVDEESVVALLRELATPPSYWLPRYSVGHSRHYMPDTGSGKDRVLDAFVVLDPGAELLIDWDVMLTPSRRDVLGHLCYLLPYLGRAEGACDARLVPESEPAAGADWLRPGDRGRLTQPPVRLLAPSDPLDIAALIMTTSEVRKSGKVVPPGSRWISYEAPSPAQRPPQTDRRRIRTKQRTTAVRLAVASNVLPSVFETVTYGHMLRNAAMKVHGTPSPTLSGREAGGGPNDWLQDNHRHAHYIFLDCDGDRLLDTALVWVPKGLTDREVDALLSLGHLRSRLPGFRTVRLAGELAGTDEEVTRSLGWRPSTTWVSATPFAPYRHQKRRQPADSFVQEEVNRELHTRELPAARVTAVVKGDWLDFRRGRPGGERQRRAVGLRLSFAQPVSGPLALGALSHFGLGLFVPMD